MTTVIIHTSNLQCDQKYKNMNTKDTGAIVDITSEKVISITDNAFPTLQKEAREDRSG